MKDIGEGCVIADGVIIEEGVVIEDNVQIDYGSIIKRNVHICSGSFIGANCIIGETLYSNIKNGIKEENPTTIIGKDSLIRSGTIIYGGCTIGPFFQTGHHVTIREFSEIGEHVSVGTLSDIQGYCKIGNYSRLHSNVHIGQKSLIMDYVWIFPYVVLTNDPTPPSETMLGVTIKAFAVIATGAVLLPGVVVGEDSLIAAGAVVTKNVDPQMVVAGVPGKVIANVKDIKSPISGKPVYPWRETFERGMPWEGIGYINWVNRDK